MHQPPTCSLAVVKIASRCNLNCSYCYMYNLGDDSALHQPKVMTDAVIDAVVRRCLDHAAARGLGSFRFVLHGGEPLLAGPRPTARLIEGALAHGKRVGVTPKFAMQTNGTLLDEIWCTRLRDWNVSVGVSLDGPRAVNDRHRVTHGGKGSYAAARAGFRRAQAHGLAPGILTVVDPACAPGDAFDHLCDLGPRTVDFLLPDANHDRPPPWAQDSTPLADWLLGLFDLWRAAPERPFRVRLFEQIMAATWGIGYDNDALGSGEISIVSIETTGDIGPVDTLRAALPGAAATGLDVRETDIETALAHPLLRLYQGSHDATLCATCRACPIGRLCGGGYLSHRYGRGRGFDNPSVHCADLTRLITGIRSAALAMLPETALAQGGLHTWTAEEVTAARAALRAAPAG